MRLLVTGASGFIGRPLVQKLRERHEVFTLGRNASDIAWDMSEPLNADVLPPRLDSVVHLAQSRDFRQFPEQAVAIARVNVGATLELLDYALSAGAKTFVFTSSGGVYGGADHPLDEAAPVTAPDFYLATKLAAETLAHAYRGVLNVVTLRLFFVYGPRQSPDRFLARLVRTVLSGERVILYGDDGIRLNPIHVSDVVAAMSASLDLGESSVINVAGPEVLTLRGITESIGSHLGKVPVFDTRPAEPQRDLVADISRLRKVLVEPRQRFVDRIGEVCEEATAAAK